MSTYFYRKLKSIVFGVNEKGQHLRNYDFHHYAPTAAGHLSRYALHRLLAGDAQSGDADFAAQVLAFRGVERISELRECAFGECAEGIAARNYRIDAMAKIVTQAAQFGAPLAQSVCQQGAAMLGIGIRLVGSCFAGEKSRLSSLSARFAVTLCSRRLRGR